MSTRNPVEGPLRSLFELSERVRDARAHAQAQLDEPLNMPSHCEAMLAEQAVEAAYKKTKLPTSKTYVDARAAEERYRFELTFLLRAEDMAMGRLQRTAAEEGETIIADHLRPVYDQVLDEARELSPSLEGATTEAAVLALDARSGWHRLQELASSYNLIREARRVVAMLQGASTSDDAMQMFSEFEDTEEWRPNVRVAPPWPEAGWARLAWIATSGCRPWLPTPAEQQARWDRWWTESGGAERARLHAGVHAMGGR